MNRGEVYLARLDPSEDSEQAGVRPVVIVSREKLPYGHNAILYWNHAGNLDPRRLRAGLLDTAGVPLSDKIYFDTSDKCSDNLVLFNWNQVR